MKKITGIIILFISMLQQHAVAQTEPPRGFLGKELIPSEFIQFLNYYPQDMSIFISGIDVGYHQVKLDDNRVMLDFKTISQKLALKPEVETYLDNLFTQGVDPDQPILCNINMAEAGVCENTDVFLATQVDLNKMHLSIWLPSSAFLVNANYTPEHLPAPDSGLSSILNYQFYNSYTKNSSPYSLSINNSLRYQNSLLQTDYTLSNNDQYGSLNSMYYQREWHELAFQSGLMGNTGSTNNFNSTNYSFSGKAIIAQLSSSNSLRTNINTPSLSPIQIFLNNEATIRVYRDTQLISVQNFGIGLHELDTTGFPSGVYPIKIETVVNDNIVNTQFETVNKPQSLNRLNSNGYGFNVFAGIGQQIRHSSFNLPYAGASYQRALTPNWLGGISSYVIDDLVVAELANEIYLPWEINANLNSAFDQQGGYGINANITRNWFKRLSTNLNYNRSKKSHTLSPFANTQSYGIYSSLNINHWLANSISLGYSRNMIKHNDRYNASYYVNLFKTRNLNISGNVSWQYNSGTTQPHKQYYTIGITLNYYFENRSSLYVNNRYQTNSKAIGSAITYNPTINSEHIDRISSSVSNEGNNTSIYSGIDLTFPWLSGNIGATVGKSTQTTLSINSGIRGQISLTPDHLMLSSKNNTSSGVLINLKGPKDATMYAVINGSRHKVSTGKNFIPLSAYKAYSLYFLNGENQYSYGHNGNQVDFTLYPATIHTLDYDIYRVSQVSGQLLDLNGSPLSFARIENHVGTSYSDESGFFMLDVSHSIPTVDVSLNDTRCIKNLEHAVNGNAQKSFIWVGTLQCGDSLIASDEPSEQGEENYVI